MKRSIRQISAGCILILLVVLLAACRGPVSSQTHVPSTEQPEPEATSAVVPNDAQMPGLTMLRLTDLVNRCGDSLSWNDFVRFHSVDLGSELCLLRYDMDEEYYLLIGGESRKKSPAFIWLVSRENPDCHIDVRTESIDAFLKRCDDPTTSRAPIKIIYADYLDASGSIWYPQLSNGVDVTPLLRSTVEEASNDDLIAFVVCGYPRTENWRSISGENDGYLMISETVEQAKAQLNLVSEQVVDDLIETLGISREEAAVRKFDVSEFAEARSVYYAALRAQNSFKLNWDLEQSNGVLEKLAVLGFTVLFDGSNPDYQDYLVKFSRHPIGVAVGTKEQILALSNEELGYDLTLSLAMRDVVDFGINDSYSEIIHLTGENKLTDELLAAYQEAGGAELPVKVKIGYFGRHYTQEEADHTVLNRMGFANKTDLYVYGTKEDEETFIQESNWLYYHKDYNDDVIARVLRDDELIRWDEFDNYFHCNFYAKLTYERALEITQNKEIAYIELLTDFDLGE